MAPGFDEYCRKAGRPMRSRISCSGCPGGGSIIRTAVAGERNPLAPRHLSTQPASGPRAKDARTINPAERTYE
jgi:hypothetical protein